MKVFVNLTFLVIIIVGYVMNIVKLVGLDFEQPYKAEIIRSVAAVMGPVGSVVGFIDIEDGKLPVATNDRVAD